MPRFYLLIAMILIASCICLNGCNPTGVAETHLTLQSGLRIDEYKLKGSPQIDPLVFEPIQSSQGEILAKYDEEREKKFSDNSFFDEKSVFGKSVLLDGQKLVAQEIITMDANTGGNQKVSINVWLGDKIIYTIQAGQVSPVTSTQGLWAYDSHWVLETAYIDRSIDDTNTASFSVTGQIVQDGKLLNEQHGYQEAFGFQHIKGKPFYFFKQDDQIGISYEGQTTPLMYEEVPHYGCCSSAQLNPKPAQNMVAFFAKKDGNWYYVEIGVYE